MAATEARSGAGDPARTLRLLWRLPDERPPERGAKRGPKQSRTLDEVVDAAIALADDGSAQGADGLAAVSMRRVAQALGIAPMSIYTYVPGKAELLDLMVDRLYAAMPRPNLRRRTWRSRLAVIARENLARYAKHPWLVGVSTVRPPLGPGVIRRYDYELSALDGLGLTDVEMDRALAFLLGFVHTCARERVEAARSRGPSGGDEQAWWEASAPILERVVDPEAYPVGSRVGRAAGEAYQSAVDPEGAFEFGLERVLDGLAAMIER